METLQDLLSKSTRDHSHLCPRQILGVRIGLAGLKALGLTPNQPGKRLLVILESDGCFADGLIAATGCTVGHRTLRVEDYGKTAATFIDTLSGRAVRVAPHNDIRERAQAHACHEPRHYFAQLQAYQTMADEDMFSLREVTLAVPVADLVSRPGLRVNCDLCGEEIINERQVLRDGLTLCRSCAGQGYYAPLPAGQNSICIIHPAQVTVS